MFHFVCKRLIFDENLDLLVPPIRGIFYTTVHMARHLHQIHPQRLRPTYTQQLLRRGSFVAGGPHVWNSPPKIIISRHHRKGMSLTSHGAL